MTKVTSTRQNKPTRKSKGRGKKQRQHITLHKRRTVLKLPQTAWILFCKQNRQSVLEENVGICFGEVCKALSVRWKLLSDEQKTPYHQAQADDKKRYVERKANLTKEEVLFLRRHRRQKRLARASRPKPPLSAYMLFVTEHRTKVCADLDVRDFSAVGRALGRAWAELPDEDRAAYSARAQSSREVYKQQVDKYVADKKARAAERKGT